MMWRCFEYGMYTRKARISTMWVHRNTPWNRSCQPSLIGSNARDARRDTGVHAAGDSFAPSEPFVPAHLPEVDGHLDADEHQDREHVLEQPEPAGPPDHRDGEPRVEDLAEGLDDRGQQDQEPPEDEGMHQPRAEALEQLPLAQDDHGLVLDALGEIVQAADGPAQPHQLPQREGAMGGRAGSSGTGRPRPAARRPRLRVDNYIVNLYPVGTYKESEPGGVIHAATRGNRPGDHELGRRRA